MSEPIREQLAEFIAEQRDHYARVPDDMDSEELANAILERFPAVSPVGGTEAAKLPLDPEPMVDSRNSRHAGGYLCDMYEPCKFLPRAELGYSIVEGDYR